MCRSAIQEVNCPKNKPPQTLSAFRQPIPIQLLQTISVCVGVCEPDETTIQLHPPSYWLSSKRLRCSG